MHPARYAENIKGATTATNMLTGRNIDLTKDVTLAPRATMIREF